MSDAPSPLVSVIVLNWNGRQFLADCLGSLAEQTYRPFEVILVDNGSIDGSAAYVRETFPWVTLVELPDNSGFAAGNGHGLRASRGEFIVTLNNDTRVVPTFLAELVKPMLEDDRIGMVAAKMHNYYDAGRIDALGVVPAISGLGLSIGHGEVDTGQHDQLTEVFGPCGGAALYRRTMLDAVGFFDPDFFAYYEDLDLAWRGRLVGWRAVPAPRALVYHVHSGTSGKMSPFTLRHLHRNKWFTILKNWPVALLLERLPLLLAVDLAALVLAIGKGRGMAALQARFEVLRALPSLLRKRRVVQQLRRVHLPELEQLMSRQSLFSAGMRRLRTKTS